MLSFLDFKRDNFYNIDVTNYYFKPTNDFAGVCEI